MGRIKRRRGDLYGAKAEWDRARALFAEESKGEGAGEGEKDMVRRGGAGGAAQA